MNKELINRAVANSKETVAVVKGKLLHFCKKALYIVRSGELDGSIQKNEINIFFFYKAILTLLYAFFQYPLFGYSGYGSNLSFFRLIIGWGVYMGTVFLIRRNKDDVCTTFTYTIFMLSIAPFIVLYEFDGSYKLWMILLQVASLLFMHGLFSLNINLPKNFRGISYRNTNLRLIAIVGLFIYFVYSLFRFGIPSLEALSFYEAHSIRSEVDLSTFESVLQNVVCKAVCPLYMIIAMKEKKWFFFGFALLLQLYTYSVTGFKTYLFIPAMVIGLQLVPKLSVKKTIFFGLPAGLFAMGLLYTVTHSAMLYALIGDRMIFMPARIKYSYFDYFSKHEFVYFSQNTISKILGVESNYSKPVPYLIGELYFNKPKMWTNTGFMADAYANMGIVGMILMAAILAAVLIVLRYALRSTSKELHKAIQSIFVIFFIAFNDGPVISELFSGGMLVAVALVLLIDFSEDAKEGKPLCKRLSSRRERGR